MKTLKEIVEDCHCRKGKSDGITKRGAYWLACDPIVCRQSGGTGCGQSSPEVTYYLQIRHYRSGEVRALVHRDAWHQNGIYSGAGDIYTSVPEIAAATTVEKVISALMAADAYSSRHYQELESALRFIGLPLSEPSPDGE